MTAFKKKKVKVKKIKAAIQKPSYNKTVKSDPTVKVTPDRITTNLSIEPFNGCWVGFGYESDVRPGETLEEAKKRCYDEVVETVTKRSTEIANDK